MQTTFQRRFTRVPFHGDAELRLGDQRLPVAVLDLSLKGALLEVARDYRGSVGDDFELELVLEDPSARITMTGQVARVEDRQLGVAGGAMDVDSMTRLRRLLELNLGDAELVHRELTVLWESRPRV